MSTIVSSVRFSGLQVAKSLVQQIPRESWFAAVGEPLTGSEESEAKAYVTALAIADVEVVGVTDWEGARRVVNDPNWDSRWWQTEEDERSRLKRELDTALSEHALLASLTDITQAASAVVHGAAAIAAGRAGYANSGMTRAAAGAATQACYLAALAKAARASTDHLFALKYNLFAAGRWPLGIVDGKLHLF